MLATELRDRVLVESGNLFLADLSMLGINASQFLTLIRNTLSAFAPYKFKKKSYVLQAENGVINFSRLVSEWQDYVLARRNGEDPEYIPVRVDAIPDMVTDVKIAQYSGQFDKPTLPYQYAAPLLSLRGAQSELLEISVNEKFELVQIGSQSLEPIPQPSSLGSTTQATPGNWSPNLIPSQQEPRQVAPSAPEDELANWEIPGIETIECFQDFLDFLTAKFLISLGRSRRSFKLADIPVEIDASEMVSEGKELLEKAEQKLYDTSDVFDTLLECPVSRF